MERDGRRGSYLCWGCLFPDPRDTLLVIYVVVDYLWKSTHLTAYYEHVYLHGHYSVVKLVKRFY